MHAAMDLSVYVCPTCRAPLEFQPQALICTLCSRAYPQVGAIPDFLAPDMDDSAAPLVRQMDRADHGALKWLSRLYESRLWYSLVIGMFLGRGATSLDDLTGRIRAALNIEQGRILDAACGTATFSRRVAAPQRSIYGIDISMAMLQTGAEHIRRIGGRAGAAGIHLARAGVDRLPFTDAYFDAAICSGALHLFPDTQAALREIGRTLKPGARLAGLTFGTGQQGLVRYAWYRDFLARRGVVRLFELPELKNYFEQAGFDWFEPQRLGAGIFFIAEKR